MSKISNVKSSLVENNLKFTSYVNPLVYSGNLVKGNANVMVLVPLHSNTLPDDTPTVTLSPSRGGNEIEIIPAFNPRIPLSAIYTQIVKISFTIEGANVNTDGSVNIEVIVDEKGLPNDNQGNLRAPKRGTKIIIPDS